MTFNANNPSLSSWVEVAEGSDFPIQNLPFGIFSTNDNKQKRVGIAIGDYVIDLAGLHQAGLIDKEIFHDSVFKNDFLNDLIKLGRKQTDALRESVSRLLQVGNDELQNHPNKDGILISMNACQMHLPVKVGDYTDFYSSEEHATNVGTMFRDPDNALLPNWKHLPVAYHGRASSIIPSGQPIRRPKGQMLPADATEPVFGPCRLLDFELEMAFITFDGKPLTESISTSEAEDYIFGMVVFNDWSARDIQKWEYVPLGPFLAKNFASSISPWVVTLSALDAYRTEGPKQDPKVLPYLSFEGAKSFDIDLEVYIQPEGGDDHKICHSNYKYMYWNMSQQLAHHTVNGCNINAGDMMASGTISGKDRSAYGSMLELSWKGTKPVELGNGEERKFLQDSDTVTMKAYCQSNGTRIGFGEVRTKILPAT